MSLSTTNTDEHILQKKVEIIHTIHSTTCSVTYLQSFSRLIIRYIFIQYMGTVRLYEHTCIYVFRLTSEHIYTCSIESRLSSALQMNMHAYMHTDEYPCPHIHETNQCIASAATTTF